MDHIQYQVLFLLLCVGAGWWVNRRSFTGFMRTVMGIPVPSYVIAGALSFFMGLIIWLMINIVILHFR